MTTDEAIKFFTRPVLYKLLKLRTPRQTVSAWGERPPMGRQYQIEILSGGQLRADDFDKRRQNKPRKKSAAHPAPPPAHDPPAQPIQPEPVAEVQQA